MRPGWHELVQYDAREQCEAYSCHDRNYSRILYEVVVQSHTHLHVRQSLSQVQPLLHGSDTLQSVLQHREHNSKLITIRQLSIEDN